MPYYWEDISSPFPDIGTASLTRLTFDKQMAFADAASAQHFSQSKRQFIRMNRRDIHYGISSSYCVRRYVAACHFGHRHTATPQQIELNVSTTCVFCSAWFVVQTSARSLTSLGSHPTCWHAKTLAQFRRGSISGSSTLHRCAA